jgi:hypothetical protein
MEAKRKDDREDFLAKKEANKEDLMAKLDNYPTKTDAILLPMQVMETSHKEIVAEWKSETEIKTMACQEMGAPQEEKPTSRDMKPEAAEEREVPVQDAEVMPVGEPRKEGRRNRNHRNKKKRTQGNNGCQSRLAAARRGTSHRATVARLKDSRMDIGMFRRARVTRRKRHILKSYIKEGKCRARRELVDSRTRTTHRAKVARRKVNSVGMDRTREKVVL